MQGSEPSNRQEVRMCNICDAYHGSKLVGEYALRAPSEGNVKTTSCEPGYACNAAENSDAPDLNTGDRYSGEDIPISPYLMMPYGALPRSVSSGSTSSGSDVEITTCEPGYYCPAPITTQNPQAAHAPSLHPVQITTRMEDKGLFDRIINLCSKTISAIFG